MTITTPVASNKNLTPFFEEPEKSTTQAVQIILMRHGKSDHNGIDGNFWYNSNPNHPNYKVSNLTEIGKNQVQESSEELLAMGIRPFNAIAYVSPLPRTQQTVAILFQNRVVGEWKTDEILIEAQAGDLEGQFGNKDANGVPYTKEAKKNAKINANYESRESIELRANKFAISLLSDLKCLSTENRLPKHVIVISHDETLHYLTKALCLDEASKAMIETGKFRVYTLLTSVLGSLSSESIEVFDEI